jgi:hypothetical protein
VDVLRGKACGPESLLHRLRGLRHRAHRVHRVDLDELLVHFTRQALVLVERAELCAGWQDGDRGQRQEKSKQTHGEF